MKSLAFRHIRFLTWRVQGEVIVGSRGDRMFKEVLREVVERTEGGIASLLMVFDGIPVENYVKSGVKIDVESVGMEYSVILTQISKAAAMLDAGTAREISIQTE